MDDAEDAEIILHEYGHALQDDQLPGFGASKEGKAMGEGFGDYLAASFFADVKPQPMRPTVGNWDAVSYSGAEPPCLRRLDSNKKYPKDIKGEEHDDGEIWSSCLWEIRSPSPPYSRTSSCSRTTSCSRRRRRSKTEPTRC